MSVAFFKVIRLHLERRDKKFCNQTTRCESHDRKFSIITTQLVLNIHAHLLFYLKNVWLHAQLHTYIARNMYSYHFTVKEIKERLWPVSRLLQIKLELRCVLYTFFLLRNMSIVAGWPEIMILCFQTPPNFCKVIYFCVSMFSVGKSQFLWACLK